MRKKNDNPTDNIDNKETESKRCFSHHNCKFCYAFLTIVLISLCAIGEHFYNKSKLSKLSENMKAIEESKKGSDLNISKLKEDVSNIINRENEAMCAICKKSEIRKKWKTWMVLKEKMEAGEPFDKEMKDFNTLFSYDKELIAVVDDLAKGVDVISSTKSGKNSIVDTCKKYFKKIVRVKKIDYRKLLEVSGYVLSSIEGCN